MAIKTKTELKALFENGDVPLETAFADLIDSMMPVDQSFIVHNDEIVTHDDDAVTLGL